MDNEIGESLIRILADIRDTIKIKSDDEKRELRIKFNEILKEFIPNEPKTITLGKGVSTIDAGMNKRRKIVDLLLHEVR